MRYLQWREKYTDISHGALKNINVGFRSIKFISIFKCFLKTVSKLVLYLNNKLEMKRNFLFCFFWIAILLSFFQIVYNFLFIDISSGTLNYFAVWNKELRHSDIIIVHITNIQSLKEKRRYVKSKPKIKQKNVCDALHDLVPFVPFLKTWKTPMEECYF